jgi:branched-subunit amino acid ABC-type transport system permease component
MNGLIAGAIYALVASGFSLIYSTCKFVNFAHGATIVFSAYVLFFLFSVLHLNLGISAFFVIILASIFGLLLNSVVYSRLRKKKANGITLLLASFSLLLLVESFILLLFGSETKIVHNSQIVEGLSFFGAVITPSQILILAVSFISLIGFFLFMKKTKIGKSMRAVSDNVVLSEILGISSEKIYALSFLIGSAVAGIAAILIVLEQNLDPFMGTNFIIKGFTAAIIGGDGSIPGAIFGAFFLGIVENLGIWFLPSGYKDAIAFVILFLFLLFKSKGILGIKKQGGKE